MGRRRSASQQYQNESNVSDTRTRRQEKDKLVQSSQRNNKRTVFSQPDTSQRNTRHFLSQPSASTSYAHNFEDSDDVQSASQDGITAHEERQLASNVIRYLFVADRSKKIIQRTHIVKNVFNGEGKKFRQVFGLVQSLFSQIFGYRLEELEGGKYILVNEIKNDILHIGLSENEKKQHILLFIVLTHIFMSDGSCTEDAVFNFLEELEIMNGENSCSDYFGDVKQLIRTEFVNQMYLEKHSAGLEQPEKVMYSWGHRAKFELTPRTVLEFVSQVYGGQALESWPRQFKAIQESEASSQVIAC